MKTTLRGRSAAQIASRAGRARPSTSACEPLESRVLMAADPIAPDHPLWIISRGTPTVDGQPNDVAWTNAYNNGFTIDRTQPTRLESGLSVAFLYDDNGLYIGFEAQDEFLWADGNGGGAGNRWEVESDDSFTVYFDPNNSRDLIFQDSDRAFGVNLAASTDPINGSGTVRRYKYVKGTGTINGIPDVNPGGALATGMTYATGRFGTANNNSDVDIGWGVEMFLPWAALNMSGLPASGTTIGINFDAIFDAEGSTRNLTDNRNGPNRFTLPHFIDDHVEGAPSSYTNTLACVRGPVNYAEAMFVDPRTATTPAAITDLAASDATPFGAKLAFTAPAGTTGGLGHVWKYEIRYASSAITTDADWAAATLFEQSFSPRLRGLSESLRISGLSPSTAYHVSVRAVDAGGNLGPISAGVSFSTSAVADPTLPSRIIVSPFGNTLTFEDGSSFIPVGDHLGVTWRHTRRLYTGDIWDLAHTQYVNFSVADLNGPYAPYFDSLQAHGINTMRVYLELQNVYVQGNSQLPRGTPWLEDDAGQFNADMQNFVLNILEECGSRGIHVLFSPFDSFSYDDAFQTQGPWGSNFGGPLTGSPGDPNGDAASNVGIDTFFQNPQTLQLAKDRMTTVIGWANASPFSAYVLGWEPLSEWDSFEWTLNTEGNTDELGLTTPGREREMRARALWINSLADHIHQQDPTRLVFNSTIVRDPRGPLARQIFLSRHFDALTPHLYVNSSSEPVNNPASDRSILPAIETGTFTQYWRTNSDDHRPIINGEWGMTRARWPGGIVQYSASFTQQEDEALYRTTIWSGLASGQAGMGLRIVTEELAFNGYLLTDTMRDLQTTFSNFVNSTSTPIDFASFHARSMRGHLSATESEGAVMLTFGVTDGRQSVVYVLNNTGAPSVGGFTLFADGLTADQVFDIEFWSTAPGTTGPSSTLSGVYSADGTLEVSLPNVTTDLAIKLKARALNPNTQIVTAVASGTLIVSFTLGADHQPIAHVYNTATDTSTVQDIAGIARYYGGATDLQSFIGNDGTVGLALTDEDNQLWLISGNAAAATWTAKNLSLSALNGQGLNGDLTFFQGIVNVTVGGVTTATPGADNIVGLNADGHVVRFRRLQGTQTWDFYDQTAAINGVRLVGSLCAYVSSYNGQNIAGLTASGQVVIYWYAPARGPNIPANWANQNMTSDFSGPTLTGQLDAYVTRWNGLNIAGVDQFGNVVTYWWAPLLTPDPNRWRVTNIRLSVTGGGPKVEPGVEVTTSVDGGINIFGRGQDHDLRLFRWLPGQGGVWNATNVTTASGGPQAILPAGGASANNRMLLSARADNGTNRLAVYVYRINGATWSAPATTITMAT